MDSIQRYKQREIVELFGKFPADSDYDYKKEGTPMTDVLVDICIWSSDLRGKEPRDVALAEHFQQLPESHLCGIENL